MAIDLSGHSAANQRPRALVTGASSGIGRAFAERLALDGYDLTLVARRRERLDELATNLQDRHGVQADVMVADLTQTEAVRIVERCVTGGDALTMLVNNAGFGGFGQFVDLHPDRAEAQIQLHVSALVRLTRAALPGMIARGNGAVVNLASVLAFSAGAPASAPLPKRAVYVGTKVFVMAFTEALQEELAGTGVRVQALCPSTVYTELHSLDGIDLSTRPAGTVMQPDVVVQASLAALRLGDTVCVPFLDDPSLVSRGMLGAFQALTSMPRDTLAPRYRRLHAAASEPPGA